MSQSSYRVHLRGCSAYGQSKALTTPKERQETHDDHESRVWRERLHVGKDGCVAIPPMSIKFALTAAAKSLGLKIPGKGKSTYTKIFESGVLITDWISLGVKPDDVPAERLFLNSDGVRGSGKRVFRNMPRIEEGWEAEVTIYVLNSLIDEKILREHLEYAGMFVGIGFFRPERGGYWGRFTVEELTKQKLAA